MMLGKCSDRWGAAGKPWLAFKGWRNSLEVGVVCNLVQLKLEVAGVAVLAGNGGGGHGSLCLALLWARPWELLDLQLWNCTAHGLRVGKIC